MQEASSSSEPPSSNCKSELVINTKKHLPANIIQETDDFEEDLMKFLPEGLERGSLREKNYLYYSWEWQLRHRITSLSQIEKEINLVPEEREGIKKSKGRLKMAITPYFFKIIDKDNPDCPIRRQVVPRIEENTVSNFDMVDPCGEDAHSPMPGLVHRYPDRVLLLVTDVCAAYCRYCTRRRMVGKEIKFISGKELERICDYIEAHKIRDVLLSGGDPLLLKDEQLDQLLGRLRKIPTVEIIRIGTRAPVTLPFRITRGLTGILKKYHPLLMSIHFIHPKEITKEVVTACSRLADAGIPLGSQTVLLKGVNNDAEIMKKLMHELLKIRVRPYYLYQCDPVGGTAHFRTPVSQGVNILQNLRGHTTGYACPTFVVDAPGGGGKIPLSPNYLLSQTEEKTVLKNYSGETFEYIE